MATAPSLLCGRDTAEPMQLPHISSLKGAIGKETGEVDLRAVLEL